MAGNTETIRDAYEAFGRGDIDGVFAAWQDDIRWEGPNAEELPNGGVHAGKEAVGQMLGGLAEAWDGYRVVPDEYHEDGDTVIVLGHDEGRAKATGSELKSPFVHVWRMRDGKVAEVQVLVDSLQQARVLGIV